MNHAMASLLFLSLSAAAYTNTPDPFHDSSLLVSPYGTGDYLSYAPYIDPSHVQVIVEVGSRDAIDAVRLGHYYQCPVYAFECNPDALAICRHNAAHYPYVTIVPYACWNKTMRIPFYPVIESLGGAAPVNMGASSLLVAKKDGCDRCHTQGTPIEVPAIRLDEWLASQGMDHIDLLCMDCQGATLQVLEGLGDALQRVKYLITEVYLTPSFEGETLYPGIRAFLEKQGFDLARPPDSPYFSDLLFINHHLLDQAP